MCLVRQTQARPLTADASHVRLTLSPLRRPWPPCATRPCRLRANRQCSGWYASHPGPVFHRLMSAGQLKASQTWFSLAFHDSLDGDLRWCLVLVMGCTLASAGKSLPFTSVHAKPVTHLHNEKVVARRAGRIPQSSGTNQLTSRTKILPALLPDEERRAPRQSLPAQHKIRSK